MQSRVAKKRTVTRLRWQITVLCKECTAYRGKDHKIKKRKGKGSMVQQLLRFRGGNLYFPEIFCVFVYLLLVILWYKY